MCIGLEKDILIFILPTFRPYVCLFFVRETLKWPKPGVWQPQAIGH